MKVEIKKIDGKSVGWSIIAETEEDKKTLNVMRDLQFWGLNDEVIEYAGRTDDGSGRNVQALHWIKKKYKN